MLKLFAGTYSRCLEKKMFYRNFIILCVSPGRQIKNKGFIPYSTSLYIKRKIFG